MKKLIYLVFLLNISTSILAQSTFEFIYNPAAANGSGFGSILNWNDSIYIVELNEDDGACYDSGNILYYDTLGNIVGGANVPGYSSTYSVYNTIRGFGNNFFSQSNSTDCGDTTIFCIAKINLSSGLIWSKVLSFNPGSVNYSRITPTSDGGCLFSYFLNSPSPIFCSVKYDQFGDTVFSKKYTHFKGVGPITYNQNNLYALASVLDSANTVLPGLVKFNFNMDSISFNYINHDSILGGTFIIFYNDTNLACIATSKDSLNNYYSCLIKIDTLGTIIWKKRFNPNFRGYFSNIADGPDGSLLASFVKYMTNPFGYDKSYILKYNVNGDSLFEKSFSNYSETFISGIRATLGGGYVGVGSIFFNGYCYMLKTDSLGNITTASGLPKSPEILVYPNPASSEISIINFNKPTTLDLKIINLQGQVVLEKHIPYGIPSPLIDVSNLENGLYFCNIYSKETKVNSSKLSIVK